MTPSQFAWEADALERLRVLLPDTDPYHAWANLEFTDGGRIHEVDALITTPKGVFLIEVKSWSGKLTGDQGTWVQERRDGSRQSYDNLVQVSNSKVRTLAGLIRRNWPGGPGGRRPPWIESLVWFSHPELFVALPRELWPHLAIDDDNAVTRNVQKLSPAIFEIGEAEAARPRFERVSAAVADDFATAMARIGFKESRRTRTAGSYELQLPAFAERGATQDFMARHKLHNVPARVRIYSNVVDASPDEAKALKDAATREFMATRNLQIDGIVRAIDSDLTDFGPAVIFEHNPKAVRLDRFMAERGDDLALDDRLHIVECMAATIREMHRRRISHRMLTPESVWLRPVHTDTPGKEHWQPLLSDFSLAARETGPAGSYVPTSTGLGSLPRVRTGALEVILGDPAMETYLAPEAFTDTNADGVALDVYSVGALAFLLVTGHAPAPNRAALRSALEAGGLSVSAVVPGIDPAIEALIRDCTSPIVSERLPDMAAVADAIGVIRAGAGTGDEEAPDPLAAGEGALLDGRFEVKRRLGKGSTAVGLWCHDQAHDRDVVLKVALASTSEERLAVEAEALRNLKNQNVVELHEQLEVGGRPTLVLSFAGERSLGAYLREEGAVSTEYLKRWGDDLLEAIRYLERMGVAHRDVKPDNLGIVTLGPRREPHLVLYDFSLAGTPAADLLAGTPPYLDPFLADDGRGRFDLAAERYAAAVTIHEMATGETPTWGDGQTDPAYLPAGVEATVLVEAIDPEVRDAVAEFLARALRRDPAQRFDTADDMARAWLAAFAEWEVPADQEAEAFEEVQRDGERDVARARLPESLTLDDPISSLDVSRKVRSALRKMGVEIIRQIAAVDPMVLNQTRGVSVSTRRTVQRLRAAVLERFADELAASPAPVSPAPPAQPTTTVHRADLDELLLRLVPPRGKRGPAGNVAETVRVLLGLTEIDDRDDWPTIAATAQHIGVTSGAVSNALQKARAHWAASPELMAVAGDLLAILADLGGVAGVSELAAPLVDVRRSGHDPAEARRIARTVTRAVIEATSPLADWFVVRRFGRRTLVAVNGAAVPADAEKAADVVPNLDPEVVHRLAQFDASSLLDLAVVLGTRADELVAENPVVTSGEAVPALRAIRTWAGQALSDARIVRLAAAASDEAGTNVASDLVRLAATPADALRWSRTALVGAGRLTPEEIVTRVAARFPAVVLPARPELDQALAGADLPFTWSPEQQAFVAAAGPQGIGPLTLAGSRQQTVISGGGTTITPTRPLEPAVAVALEIDDRLRHSIDAGGFLALRVPTDHLVDAQRGLARFQTGTPPMTLVDLEATFLRHLRATAERRRIAWANLESADDPRSANWAKLSVVAEEAVDATVDEVAATERAIAWFPGALVRHASPNRPAPIDRLLDAVMSAERPLRTLWLVVLGGAADALPTIDGEPVPVLAQSQWLDLTDTWLRNVHRAGGMTA